MRIKTLLIGIFCSLSFWAQSTPSHPQDIKQGKHTALHEFFADWEVGKPPAETDAMDDQFYISRVRLLNRIDDNILNPNAEADPNRKLFLWVPADDPTVTWKTLPRYCFEGDNFSMWSYADSHGNWSAPFFRVSAGLSDAAAKNGVTVGCVLNFAWTDKMVEGDAIDKNTGKPFQSSTGLKFLIQKNDDDSFKYSDKLVRLMKYYGINAIGFNSEIQFSSTNLTILQDFFIDCHEKAAAIDWKFEVHWYDGVNNAGRVGFPDALSRYNDKNFFNKEKSKVVSDMFFLNYNWTQNKLTNSQKHAESLGADSYNVYAGMDIQGRGLNAGATHIDNAWSLLADKKLSIGFWGAHDQSSIHGASTDNGGADIAIQKSYLEKQELVFSGGERNPAKSLDFYEKSSLGNADLKKFHGLSKLVTAKSTLQQLPFVSRFNLGNGLFFNNEGKTSFDHKWYNLSMQDFLPTWRWWITNNEDKAEGQLIEAGFVFDDAWFGGSCLKFNGQTTNSRVRLFKTQFDVEANHEISLTYKVLNGVEPKAKIFVATKDALTSFKEIKLPNADVAGEWKTYTAKLSDLGITGSDVISLIGLSFENTSADYELLLGELSLLNPSQKFSPVAPVIKEVKVLRGHYDGVDFKIHYQSKEESGEQKTYNDEVDTWYFEIFFQQQGKEQQLLTTTTSWAAYVIDAPVTVENRAARYGVRAVAPDGKTKSEIVWSGDFEELGYVAKETVVINKPVIKPNEKFKINFEDVLHPSIEKWEVINPISGSVVGESANSAFIELSIPEIGVYDLHLTDKGNTTITRGFVQITTEETGAVPSVETVELAKSKIERREAITLTYTSNRTDGTVSRALRINDPNMFRVPAEAHPSSIPSATNQNEHLQSKTGHPANEFSYAFWFKADRFAHASNGTNLINKNTIHDKWPINNWGDLWVQVRPEQKDKAGKTYSRLNEISFDIMSWGQSHQLPEEKLVSKGVSITPGVWYHLVVSQSGGDNPNREQRVYLNGKLVAQANLLTRTRVKHDNQKTINKPVNADIYFGGPSSYKAGFDGLIDEVQIWNKQLSDEEVLRAMKGYKKDEVPNELLAYYTFEEMDADGAFPNEGKGGGNLKGSVVFVGSSGGENTSNASYVLARDLNNDELGYPGIPGSLEIKTSAEWILPGATQLEAAPEAELATRSTKSNSDKSISVKYLQEGTYDVGLKLSNRWGKDELQKTAHIVVEGGPASSVNTLSQEVQLSVYPNPFADLINLLFTDGGKYSVKLSSLSGQVISIDTLNVSNNETVQLVVDASPGVYVMQIEKEGKIYKILKLIRK